jgi:hypothetical protein
MKKQDETVLILLACGVGIAWLSSLRIGGGAFGWPALASGDPKPAQKPEPKREPNRQGNKPQKGRPSPDNVIDVSNPRVIGLEEWKKRRAEIEAGKKKPKKKAP